LSEKEAKAIKRSVAEKGLTCFCFILKEWDVKSAVTPVVFCPEMGCLPMLLPFLAKLVTSPGASVPTE
jgi:hypothetical protein